MRRDNYFCPYCSQTSTRRYNLKTHIYRRHKGRENPFGPLPSPTFGSLAKENDVLHYRRNYDRGFKSSFSPDNNASSPHHIGRENRTKEINPSDRLMKELQEASQLRDMINRTQNDFGSPLAQNFNPMLIGVMMSMDPNALLFLKTMFESQNIGFRGQACKNCFAYWIDPILDNGGGMKFSVKAAKPSSHSCDPKNIATVEGIRDAESKIKEIENKLVNMVAYLTYACTSVYLQKPLLITEKLMEIPLNGEELLRRGDSYWKDDSVTQQQLYPNFWMEGKEANCNHIDVNLVKLGETHWANRAIGEVLSKGKSTLVMDSNEPFEFVQSAKGTFGAFTTDVGDSLQDFLMYISFKNVEKGKS